MSATEDAQSPADSVRIAAVGDILLAAGPVASARDPQALFAPVRNLLADCDVAFGNLECTLPGDGATVPTEPRVVSTPELIRSVQTAGFTVLSLANNHVFDHLQAGFHRVRNLLQGMGVAWFGAGDDPAQAAAPAVIDVRGLRLAFVGAVDESSGVHRFAGPDQWGVAPLDMERLTTQIKQLKQQADHVIVSPHWGEERFGVPSPRQIEQAHAMVDAGASMVLGHHPHVIQGLEMHCGCPIIYSLGNFVANDVPFRDGDVMRWNRTERTSCVVVAELTRSGVGGVRQVATFDDGCQVRPDDSGFGDRRIAKANRALARGVTLKRYRREYLWVKTVKPALTHLRWGRLKKLRWRNVRRACHNLLKSRQIE